MAVGKGQGNQVEIGQILADKFRVERVLGVGGMGSVVAATHLHLDQLVALKFMLPELAADKALVARFLREAKAAVRLKSRHCAKVMDVGTLEHGEPYIVMEYLEGHDLQEVVDNEGALPVERAVEYLLQTCIGMAEAHRKGIVHRDLKPQNLFLSRAETGEDEVKILDFGIAKASFDVDSAAKTQTTAVMGSPYFMAPEQMRSAKNADARSDIWALGAILHFLLSAHLPFEGESLPVLCMEILTNPPRDLRELRGELPESLVAIVDSCLQKDPSDRPQSVVELAERLADFAPTRARDALGRVRSMARVETEPGSESAASLEPAQGEKAEASEAGGQGQRFAATVASESRPGQLYKSTLGASVDVSTRTEQDSKGKGAYLWTGAGVAALALAALFFTRSPGEEAPAKPPASGADTKSVGNAANEVAPATSASPDQETVSDQAETGAATNSGQGSSNDADTDAKEIVAGEATSQVTSKSRKEGRAGRDARTAKGKEGASGFRESGGVKENGSGFRERGGVDEVRRSETPEKQAQDSVPKEEKGNAEAPVKKTTTVETGAAQQAKGEEGSQTGATAKAQPKAKDRLERRLRNLKKLREGGLISEDEYRRRRREILDEEL